MNDTIIIDGKVVLVEKREVEKSPQDTIHQANSKAGKGDHRGEAKNLNLTIGAYANLPFTYGHSETNLEGFETLNSFIGQQNSICIGYETGIISGFQLADNFQLSVGLGLEKICFRNRTFDPASLQPDSLRMNFTSFSKGTLDEIALYYIDPGFETDTFKVKLNEADLDLSAIQIPVEFQFNFGKAKKNFGSRTEERSFWNAGVNATFHIRTKTSGGSFTLVNHNGNHKTLNIDELEAGKTNISAAPFAGYAFRIQSMEINIRVGFRIYGQLMNSNQEFLWDGSSPFAGLTFRVHLGNGS